jgi:hypothetical protein
MVRWVVKGASGRSRIEDLSGDSSVRGARIRGVLASRASVGQRGLSARGVEPELQGCSALRRYRMNRVGGGRGLGSESHLESVEWPRGRSGRCPGGQPEVREDLGDHGGIFDGGDELQGAAALRALLDVDLEYPLEQPGPAQAHRRHGRGRRIPFLSSLSGQHSVSRSLHTPSSPTKKGTDYLTHTCDHIVSSVALSEVWRDSDQ